MYRYRGGGGGAWGNTGNDGTSGYGSGSGRGGYGNWGGPGGGYTNPPVAQPSNPAPPASRPPSTVRVTHTVLTTAGNPGPGPPGSPNTAPPPSAAPPRSPTNAPQPNPAESSSGPGVGPAPTALNALAGPVNVSSGSEDNLLSNEPSVTASAFSTVTTSSGAKGVRHTSTISNDVVPRPPSSAGAGGGASLAGILVGVFGGLILFFAIVVGVIVLRRRRRLGGRNGKFKLLVSREDEGEPLPFTLPAPDSPPFVRPPRPHRLDLDDVALLQDHDVERSPMQQIPLYSPITSPIFTRESKIRRSQWPRDRLDGSNPTSASTWVQFALIEDDRSTSPSLSPSSSSSEPPDSDPDQPASEALEYADPPPAYQTGSVRAPLTAVAKVVE